MVVTITILTITEDLDISINGPSKAELKKEAKGNSTAVGYVPMAPGEYSIDIKVKGQHIHGSPFLSKVTGQILLLDVVSLHSLYCKSGS